MPRIMTSASQDPLITRPSIFLHLGATGEPREVAWEKFSGRYVPLLRAFARRLGATADLVDDVVQEVLRGFFQRAPQYVHDPSKGRFRGYLFTCAMHAMSRLEGKRARFCGRTWAQLDQIAHAVRAEWDDATTELLMHRATDEARRHYSSSSRRRTFLAFEHVVVNAYTVEQTARLLDMPPNNVAQACHRVRDYISARIQEYDALDW